MTPKVLFSTFSFFADQPGGGAPPDGRGPAQAAHRRALPAGPRLLPLLQREAGRPQGNHQAHVSYTY